MKNSLLVASTLATLFVTSAQGQTLTVGIDTGTGRRAICEDKWRKVPDAAKEKSFIGEIDTGKSAARSFYMKKCNSELKALYEQSRGATAAVNPAPARR